MRCSWDELGANQSISAFGGMGSEYWYHGVSALKNYANAGANRARQERCEEGNGGAGERKIVRSEFFAIPCPYNPAMNGYFVISVKDVNGFDCLIIAGYLELTIKALPYALDI